MTELLLVSTGTDISFVLVFFFSTLNLYLIFEASILVVCLICSSTCDLDSVRVDDLMETWSCVGMTGDKYCPDWQKQIHEEKTNTKYNKQCLDACVIICWNDTRNCLSKTEIQTMNIRTRRQFFLVLIKRSRVFTSSWHFPWRFPLSACRMMRCVSWLEVAWGGVSTTTTLIDLRPDRHFAWLARGKLSYSNSAGG